MNLTSIFRSLAIVLLAAIVSPHSDADAQTSMRAVGNFSSNKMQVDGVERPFFSSLAEKSGLDLQVSYNPMDQINVQSSDALRLLKSGAFDVMSVQIGQASRDDPFFEGIDLIGVSTDMKELRKVVDAYRDVFDERLQKKFKAKVLTLWPFGPQVFFCNKEVHSIDDFKGLKVRSYTPSMAALVEYFGATPVTLSFNEVYPALQRGVVNCGVTAPSAGNSGNWPEVTTHFLPLSVSGGMQGHFVSLLHWNRYTPEQQQKLQAEFKRMEDQMWDLAVKVNEDASNCNVGAAPCDVGHKFKMTMVNVTPESKAKLKDAVSKVVLPIWKQSCNRVDPQCTATWNNTVGKVSGFKID